MAISNLIFVRFPLVTVTEATNVSIDHFTFDPDISCQDTVFRDVVRVLFCSCLCVFRSQVLVSIVIGLISTPVETVSTLSELDHRASYKRGKTVVGWVFYGT